MHRILFLLLCSNMLCAQTIPLSRSVDWSNAHPIVNLDEYDEIIIAKNMMHGDGITPNDEILKLILDQVLLGRKTKIFLEAGIFLFNKQIVLPSNIVLKGKGSESTVLKMDLKGNGDAILIKGTLVSKLDTIKLGATMGDQFLLVQNADEWKQHDWVRISQQDTDLVTSDWAHNSVGQMVEINKINSDTLFLRSKLRLDLALDRVPIIREIIPIENVGIECLSIKRIDDTAPQQSSNIFLENAVNCWVSGIESTNCTFGHITIASSSNIQVRRSYFHDGFDYGGNGRAYGIVLQFTSGECLIENNIFNHLRHSVLLQAGANGNVITYNYSRDPFWTSFPSDASGDMVLHGNYVFANLFEQNICQNIVIDNSHGPNGPYNTFFRNRAEKYGIYFSADNSHFQNIVGNEITNSNFPYSLVNYSIQGKDQFEFSNNNKGVIVPMGESALPETSLFYKEKPYFLQESQWGGIGSPNLPEKNFIPAYERWLNNSPMENGCTDSLVLNEYKITDGLNVICFPNPFGSELKIHAEFPNSNYIIFDAIGRVVFKQNNLTDKLIINTSSWKAGVYYIQINSGKDLIKTVKIIKN